MLLFILENIYKLYDYFPILENILTSSVLFSNFGIRSEYDYPSQLFRATDKVER